MPKKTLRSVHNRAFKANFVSTAMLGMVAIAGASVAPPADAASAKSKQVEAQPKKGPSGPLVAVVSIRNQRISVYDKNGRVTSAPVSTGTSGHDTPTGIFSVIGKEKMHYSNLYNDAEMPYMQRITWSGVAMHAGNLPGYPASHGCIRLPYSFSQQLFGITRMNTRVIVARNDVAPFEIAHPNLFVPKPSSTQSDVVASLVPPQSSPAIKPVSFDGTPSSAPSNPPMMLGGDKPAQTGNAAATGAVQAVEPAKPAAKTIAQLKIETTAFAAEAAKTADAAKKAANLKAAEAQKASRLAKTAENAKTWLDTRIAGAAKAMEIAKSPELLVRASDAKTAAEAKLADLALAASDARAIADAAQLEANAALAAAKTAEAGKTAAATAARLAAVRSEPVSVFISRKTGKLYVRQGFEPIFETPVTFQDDSQPVGTHVFTALELKDGGMGMRWNAVTITGDADEPRPQKSKKNRDGEAQSPPVRHARTAASALDRLSIPKDTVDRISELMSPGSSLIISDNGISNETGKGTDFVILTR